MNSRKWRKILVDINSLQKQQITCFHIEWLSSNWSRAQNILKTQRSRHPLASVTPPPPLLHSSNNFQIIRKSQSCNSYKCPVELGTLRGSKQSPVSTRLSASKQKGISAWSEKCKVEIQEKEYLMAFHFSQQKNSRSFRLILFFNHLQGDNSWPLRVHPKM